MRQRQPRLSESVFRHLEHRGESMQIPEETQDPKGLMDQVKAMDDDVGGHLDDLDLPVLVVHGAQDIMVEPDEGVRVPFDTGIFLTGRYVHGYGDRAVTLADGSVVHEDDYERLRLLKAVSDEPICRFEFAYAVTCHKAQGGQWKCVFVDKMLFGEEEMTRDLLQWLYTAITRATEKLYFINFDERFFEVK